MKITKRELQEMVRKCTKQVLQETLQGETIKRNRRLKLRTRRRLNELADNNEEDEFINSPQDGPKRFVVGLWPGQGYYLPTWKVYADHMETALELVVAYLDKKGDNDFFFEDEVYREEEEMRKEGKTDEEIDDEIDEWALYVDAMEFGAKSTHYVLWENLLIREIE